MEKIERCVKAAAVILLLTIAMLPIHGVKVKAQSISARTGRLVVYCEYEGKPISGAHVGAGCTSVPIGVNGVSGSSGTVVFDNLPDGAYGIAADATVAPFVTVIKEDTAMISANTETDVRLDFSPNDPYVMPGPGSITVNAVDDSTGNNIIVYAYVIMYPGGGYQPFYANDTPYTFRGLPIVETRYYAVIGEGIQSPSQIVTVTLDSSHPSASATIHYSGAPSFLGDINGDFKVDIKDLVLVMKYFNSYPGSGKLWNPNADVNGDNKVDIKDLVLVIKHYGQRGL